MSIGQQLLAGPSVGACLHWYNPTAKILMMTNGGVEVYKSIVFELQLESTHFSGQREHEQKALFKQKALFMDDVEGAHHVLRIFHTDAVEFAEGQGISCQTPTLLLCWQLRPGLGVELSGVAHATTRKRQLLTADDSDMMLKMTLLPSNAKRVRFEEDSESAGSHVTLI
jgi:hypothetical protein